MFPQFLKALLLIDVTFAGMVTKYFLSASSGSTPVIVVFSSSKISLASDKVSADAVVRGNAKSTPNVKHNAAINAKNAAVSFFVNLVIKLLLSDFYFRLKAKGQLSTISF